MMSAKINPILFLSLISIQLTFAGNLLEKPLDEIHDKNDLNLQGNLQDDNQATGTGTTTSNNLIEKNNDKFNESIEKRAVQAINSYLTDLNEPLKLDKNSILPHLNDALYTIENLGLETFSKMTIDELEKVGLSKFSSLLKANDPKIIVSILNDIIKTTKSCNQESVNYLMLLIEHETFDGQLLNKFSNLLLKNCHQLEISTLSYRISRIIGKMKINLFDLFGELANIYDNIKKEALTRLNGDITIRDQVKTESSIELLRQLKQIEFDSNNNNQLLLLRSFALTLNRYFNKQFLVDENDKRIQLSRKEESKKLRFFFNSELLQPCDELINRIKTLLIPILNYKKFFPEISFNNILESNRLNDKDLDYQLEVYRICRKVQDNEKQLWQILSYMR